MLTDITQIKQAQDALPVVGMDHLEVPVMEAFLKLLFAVAEQYDKALVDIGHGEPAVVKTLLHPDHQVLGRGDGGRPVKGRGGALGLVQLFPDDQRLVMLGVVEVDPQRGPLIPDVFPRGVVEDAVFARALHQPAAEEVLDILVQNFQHQRPVVGMDGVFGEGVERFGEGVAGAQVQKVLTLLMDQMVDPAVEVHLHDGGFQIAQQRQVFHLPELRQVLDIAQLDRGMLRQPLEGGARRQPVGIAARELIEILPHIFQAFQKLRGEGAALPV